MKWWIWNGEFWNGEFWNGEFWNSQIGNGEIFNVQFLIVQFWNESTTSAKRLQDVHYEKVDADHVACERFTK